MFFLKSVTCLVWLGKDTGGYGAIVLDWNISCNINIRFLRTHCNVLGLYVYLITSQRSMNIDACHILNLNT